MRPYWIGAAALGALLSIAPATAITATQATDEQTAAVPCGDCHDQADVFATNPHARGYAKEAISEVCTSCHGDGTAHIEGGGDKELITVPRGRQGAEETCRMCHDLTSDKRSHAGGAHANSAAVNCLSCHSIHSSEARAAHLLVKRDPGLCSECHSTQAASFRNSPYAHKVGRGAIGCTSCHDPHARPGRENLKTTKAGEPACLECHTEKRGPFVFSHGAMEAGDCMSCHDPHGSPNPKQLIRTRVDQLCLECHSPLTSATLGSQPPSFHNLTSPRYRNCTTCHAAIHGSNRSPQLLK